MSFTKDSCFPVIPGIPNNAKSEHMVCSDPVCPTSSDPYTGRVMCRCYQMPELRDQAPNPQMFTTSGYPGLYPSTYSLDSAPTVTSPLQSSQGLNPYTTTMMNNTYQPQFIPQGTTMPQLDNILRSQVYNYMYPGVLDLNSVARRKNATRETTSALKSWLQQHKKNPYPTKAEKIMLAIVTKMTLTQVSTWFANARRRLKKEHKGDWSSDNSFDNISDNENEDNENDDVNKQNTTLNVPNFNERLPMLHSTPIPNRVPDVPKEHTNAATHAQDRLPGFSSFSSLTSFSADQSQQQCLISPPIQPTTQCFTMSSLPQTMSLPLFSVPSLPSQYPLCQDLKYDNHIYAQTFSRASHLDSESESNQNCSGSSLDDSDKENSHVASSQQSTICSSALEKKSLKLSSNSVVSKPKIWSISEIIGTEKESCTLTDTNGCTDVKKE